MGMLVLLLLLVSPDVGAMQEETGLHGPRSRGGARGVSSVNRIFTRSTYH